MTDYSEKCENTCYGCKSLASQLEILRDQNQAMKDILRDAIGLMRSTAENSGWHQVAKVAESLVNSKFTTEKG